MLTSSPLNKDFPLPKTTALAKDSLEATPKLRVSRGPSLLLGSPKALAAAKPPFAKARQPHGTRWHGCKEQRDLVLDTDTRHGCCLAEVCRFACGSYHCSGWSSPPPSAWSHWKGPSSAAGVQLAQPLQRLKTVSQVQRVKGGIPLLVQE